MDPELQALSVQLADATLRNTARGVLDKIKAVKAAREDRETIAELEEIVNGLLDDKNELVRIAHAYEQQLVAQQISQADIEYITNNFVPVLREMMESAPDQSAEAVEALFALVQPLLSVETVTVMQLLGFNLRRAIGEPLTDLVAQMISARRPGDPSLTLETQRLLLAIAQDPDAYDRFVRLTGQRQG